MPSIHCRGITHAHSSAVAVFRDLDLDLDAGPTGRLVVGVAGANGAGKSTLLSLLAGQCPPDGGTVRVESRCPPVLVPQRAPDPPPDVVDLLHRWDGPAARLRGRFGLDVADLLEDPSLQWSRSSPGMRTRWLLAAAFAQEPDVLLLDEPTNHLDGPSLDLLGDLLARHRGLVLVVSHDRAFLDRHTQRTMRVHDGVVDVHDGSWSTASSRWRADADARRDDHDRARRAAARERRLLADLRRERHGAEAGARRDRRTGGARDPDAREAGRKRAAAKAEAALARRVRQHRTRTSRADAAVADVDVPRRDRRGEVRLRHAGTGRSWLAEVVGEVANLGGGACLQAVDVALPAAARVHVRGANGAGKSTLLRALVRSLHDTGVTVAHLDQEEPVVPLDLSPRLLGIAARLGVDVDRARVSDRWSPGEARKFALAHALTREVAVVVLDEPTNHLDVLAIETLQEALTDWTGALVLVTHDHALAAATTTTTWTVHDGAVTVAGGRDGTCRDP